MSIYTPSPANLYVKIDDDWIDVDIQTIHIESRQEDLEDTVFGSPHPAYLLGLTAVTVRGVSQEDTLLDSLHIVTAYELTAPSGTFHFLGKLIQPVIDWNTSIGKHFFIECFGAVTLVPAISCPGGVLACSSISREYSSPERELPEQGLPTEHQKRHICFIRE